MLLLSLLNSIKLGNLINTEQISRRNKSLNLYQARNSICQILTEPISFIVQMNPSFNQCKNEIKKPDQTTKTTASHTQLTQRAHNTHNM